LISTTEAYQGKVKKEALGFGSNWSISFKYRF